MKRFKYVLMLAVLMLSLLLSGCGGQEAQKDKGGDFVIVTSFYPIYVDVLNITNGVEGVKVVNMTKPQTGCLHD